MIHFWCGCFTLFATFGCGAHENRVSGRNGTCKTSSTLIFLNWMSMLIMGLLCAQRSRLWVRELNWIRCSLGWICKEVSPITGTCSIPLPYICIVYHGHAEKTAMAYMVAKKDDSGMLHTHVLMWVARNLIFYVNVTGCLDWGILIWRLWK